jgi:hypothetical protein
MIRTLFRAPDGQVRANLQPEDRATTVRESEGFLH